MQNSLVAISFLAAAACSSTSSAKPILVPAPVAVPSLGHQENVVQLAARRAQLIGWLHDYREAGVFPTDLTGKPASVFMDHDGVRCPMAELLHKSGRDDLVAAVNREANGVRLIDVKSGPLFDWMMSSGLTLAEINLVQGAMNISFDWMEIEEPQHEQHILAGKAAVRAKLEVAEMALRDNTGASLATIAAKLPGTATIAQLASTPVSGAAVPAAAIPKPVALRIVQPPQRRVIVRQQRYPQFQFRN